MYVSAVAGQPARSRTDEHADASTFVPRKATTDGFATGPTRSPFADALKVTEIMVHPRDSFYDLQEFHLMTDEFHFIPDEFHLMPEPN